MISALASTKGWPIHHLNVNTAFLNGRLTDEVYMEQPRGYELTGNDHLVCRLDRALYGLKQAPRRLYRKIDRFLQLHKLKKSSSDNNLYFLHHQRKIMILVLYVDDIFIIGNHNTKITWLSQQLHGSRSLGIWWPPSSYVPNIWDCSFISHPQDSISTNMIMLKVLSTTSVWRLQPVPYAPALKPETQQKYNYSSYWSTTISTDNRKTHFPYQYPVWHHLCGELGIPLHG